jgi:hypothetical protein
MMLELRQARYAGFGPTLAGKHLARQGLGVSRDILQSVKAAVTIPVAVKLSPFFSNMANMTKRLDALGADGLGCSDPAAFERAQYTRAVKGVQHVVVTGREAWRILSDE